MTLYTQSIFINILTLINVHIKTTKNLLISKVFQIFHLFLCHYGNWRSNRRTKSSTFSFSCKLIGKIILLHILRYWLFSFSKEFTHIDSIETCRQYLAAHEWDVERAIETALVSNADLPSTPSDIYQRQTTDASIGEEVGVEYSIPSAPPLPAETQNPSASTQFSSNNPMNDVSNTNNST